MATTRITSEGGLGKSPLAFSCTSVEKEPHETTKDGGAKVVAMPNSGQALLTVKVVHVFGAF